MSDEEANNGTTSSNESFCIISNVKTFFYKILQIYGGKKKSIKSDTPKKLFGGINEFGPTSFHEKSASELLEKNDERE